MTSANWARLSLLLVTALILQVSILDEIVIAGAHPDLFVLITAAAGLTGGSTRGAVVGFLSGFVSDLVVNTPYGLSAVTFVLLGFACGMLRFLSGERRTTGSEIVACIAAGAVGTFLFAVIGTIAGQHAMLGRSAIDAVLVVTLGAVVLSPIALKSVQWALNGTAANRSTAAIPSGGSALG